jgi:hypothetical protein
MELIADILLAAGAFGAGLYCLVLSRRLRAFNQLETGMGGAIATLSAQVDDLTRALATARDAAGESGRRLDGMTIRAEEAARKLELMLASLHDLPADDHPRPDDHGAQEDGGGRRMRVLRRRGSAGTVEATP